MYYSNTVSSDAEERMFVRAAMTLQELIHTSRQGLVFVSLGLALNQATALVSKRTRNANQAGKTLPN
jgi:hypothetical protein